MPQNFDLTQTGTELQERINQVFPNRDNIAAENQRAEGVEAQLGSEKATRAELAAEAARATGREDSLQAQIDAIVSKDATVSLATNPSAIFVAAPTSIALTASTNTTASAISIKRADTTIAQGSGNTLTHTDADVSVDAPGTLAYSADFTISGLPRSASKSVAVVYPIAYGAMSDYNAEQLTQYATPTTSVARTYTVQLDSTRRKFYLRVPKQGVAQVKSVVMGSGSEASPVSGGIVAELSDENYNVWASDDGFTGNGPQVFTVS